MENFKKKLREYAVLTSEVRVFDFIESLEDFINNVFLKPGLSWPVIFVFRFLPWMLGNVLFAFCMQPLMLWLVRFFFSIPNYISFFC